MLKLYFLVEIIPIVIVVLLAILIAGLEDYYKGYLYWKDRWKNRGWFRFKKTKP